MRVAAENRTHDRYRQFAITNLPGNRLCGLDANRVRLGSVL